MCFPYCVLIGDFHSSRKDPPPSLSVCVHSSFAVRRYWQSHNVAWRNAETLAPSSIFQRSIKVLNLWAAPLPPLAIIDPSGLRWVCEYGTRLFIYSPTPPRVLELLVPAVCNSQAVLLTLLRRKKHTQKKKKSSSSVVGRAHPPPGRPLVTEWLTGRLI